MDKKEFLLAKIKMSANRIISVAFILIVGAIGYFMLFKSLAINYETGYITTVQQGFILTVKGKRHSMVNSPVSLFEINSYEDSMQYQIPRDRGIVEGVEIATEPGHRKPMGTITIKNDKCKINLFIYNTTNKKVEADSWNGQYKLEWGKE